MVEAIARVRLADWAGALAAIEHHYKRPYVMILTPMGYDFLRSLIYSPKAAPTRPAPAYERGMVAWEEHTADDPDAWEHSDAMRWRREAEAVLAK